MGQIHRQSDVGALLDACGQSGPNEVTEQGVWPVGTALEFGMELTGDEPRVVGQLDDLDQLAVRRLARADETRVFESRAQPRVDLVTVSVAFVDQLGPVGSGCLRARQ